MVWPLVAMAAVSAVGSIVSANSASAQNKTQAAWGEYNAQMGYQNDMSNLASQSALGMFNASMQMKAASANAQATLDVAAFNAGQVQAASAYNNLLLDEEERLMWEAADLDVANLERQRARERGEIVNTQASSGTTIGEGSNLDVVADQMAQEAMDAFVIRHNADIGASKIQNAQAQGSWQAQAQVQKIMYEGQMGAAVSMNNARMAAGATAMETAIGYQAGARSAQYGLSSGISGASQSYSANEARISGQLTQGLFSAASSAVGSAYGGASVTPTSAGPTGMGSLMDSSSTNPGNIMGSF